MLESFNPSAHITTQNLSYEQNCSSTKVTILHLPRTKMASAEH